MERNRQGEESKAGKIIQIASKKKVETKMLWSKQLAYFQLSQTPTTDPNFKDDKSKFPRVSQTREQYISYVFKYVNNKSSSDPADAHD